MNKIKKMLIRHLIPDTLLWDMCGNIAERFYDRDDGEWDILQDKLYYWIHSSIYEN